MWAGDRCPHCGCPLDQGGTDPQIGGTAVDVEMDRSIELLQTEVEELRDRRPLAGLGLHRRGPHRHGPALIRRPGI